MARRTPAARQVISSVGHSPSHPGFSGDGKGLPAGSIEASPCRPRRFRGRACLPGRGDDPPCSISEGGPGAGQSPAICRRFYRETAGRPGMWPLPAAMPFECSFIDADVSPWLRSGFVMASADATDHGMPGRFCLFCLVPFHRVRLTDRITYRPSGTQLPGRRSHARSARLPPNRWSPRRCRDSRWSARRCRDSRCSTGGGRPARFR